MKPRRASPMVLLFPPSCHSLRCQPSRPEAWTRGWRGMRRHYHNKKRKFYEFNTAPVSAKNGYVRFFLLVKRTVVVVAKRSSRHLFCENLVDEFFLRVGKDVTDVPGRN